MQVSEKLVELLQQFDTQNPNINFLMTNLSKVLYMTTIELNNYYWHNPLSKEIRDLTKYGVRIFNFNILDYFSS